MARTPQSTRTCTMRSSEHAAHRLLMHSVHTSHLWLKVSLCVSFHVIHACAPVCCSLSVSPHPSFYFLVLFLFQLYLMSDSAPDEFSIEDPLCNSSLGSMVTLDCVTPLTNWECLFVHREKGLFLSVYVDDINWLERNKILIRCGKLLNKEVDLGEPTSFLDHVYLGCTQRQCEISKDTVDNYRTMFESRISAGGSEKLPFPQNLRISSWSYDMEGHAKKCVERYCELANKTTQQLYKVSAPCIDDHHFKEEEMKSVGEVSKIMLSNCSEMLIFGSNWTTRYSMVRAQLARSITKWTKACVKRLNRLISYIHYTCEYKQYCHVGNTAKQCRLGLFQDSDIERDLEDSKSTSGGALCVWGSHTFVPISWMCKKQAAVSHSSTESEIISLDTGLRLDCLPALELWDLIVSVLGNVFRYSDRSGKPESDDHKHYKSHNKIDVIKDIDAVPSNVQSAR